MSALLKIQGLEYVRKYFFLIVKEDFLAMLSIFQCGTKRLLHYVMTTEFVNSILKVNCTSWIP